ncbi:TPA: hypothetical protein ACF5VS_002813, partial [Staphylococcus aureus]
KKNAQIPFTSRKISVFIKSSYFYIVSRQEETRFQLVSKTFQKPSIHKNTTRMTLKIQDYN